MLTIVLMAVFVAVNFLAMRIFARVNNVITWWKVAVPVLAIIVLLFKFHPGNFTAGRAGFMPGGIKALFGALPAAGIIFAYSGFEQADQLAGEVKNPQRNLPLAIIGAVLIGTAIYVPLQIVFIGATPEDLIKGHLVLADILSKNPYPRSSRLLAWPGVVGLTWLAVILRLDAFVSPDGTGQDYMTATSRVSDGLARNRYYPSMFAKTDRNGIPWVAPIFSFVRPGVPAAVPKLALSARPGHRASVLMYAGAPGPGRFPARFPSSPAVQDACCAVAPSAFAISDLIIYWSGFEVDWKRRHLLVLGY